MTLKAIKTSTVQEMVYERLLNEIIRGKILPGERITLERISKALDVSAMPVREAIRKLEAERFVSVERNRRIIVNEINADTVDQILEIRILLEGYAAKKACTTIREESLIKMEKLLDQMKDAEDEEVYLMGNKKFHYIMYNQSKSKFLMEMINLLWDKFSPYLHILLQNEKIFHSDILNKYHYGIFNGLKKKNPEMVHKWLEKDLTEAAKQIKAMLRKDE